MEGKRKILGLGGKQAFASIFRRAELGQWQLLDAGNAAEARALAANTTFYTGLLLLDQAFLDSDKRLFEDLIGDLDVLWIGLRAPEVGQSTSIEQAIAKYVYDYHTLPVNSGKLQHTLGHAYGMARIKQDISLQRDDAEQFGDTRLIGTGPAMRSIFRAVQKLAAVSPPVLISGESGTGKELVARAIHQHSSRAAEPFVTVNCGALPVNLIQSELFGHEKGAFTGAHQRKPGRIEAADGGTIFLDEVDGLPYELQANLLRFLQEGTIERVGGLQSISVNARVLAASHVTLEQAVHEDRFREDLFYRLNVLPIDLPALRERREDIEPLARFYFRKFQQEQGSAVQGFSRQAWRAMHRFGWPGNVRELINRIYQAVLMCETSLIGSMDLGLDQQVESADVASLSEFRDQAEKRALEASFADTRHNLSASSRQLGISRVTLYQLMRKHGMR